MHSVKYKQVFIVFIPILEQGIALLSAFNPIKAGGSESMYSLGRGRPPPTLEKGLREQV